MVAILTAVETFFPSMCQCDDSLLETSCSGSKLDSVPILLNPSFAGLASPTVLDISANRLTRLTDDLFAELPSLFTLILSGNKIQTVASGAFNSPRKRHTLRLEDNNLGNVPTAALTLEDGAFRHFARLRLLALNDNAIDRVDPLAFDSLVSLDALDLSNNRLDGPIEAFTTVSPLTHLDLSGNMWRHLPANFLSGLLRLQTLIVFSQDAATITNGSVVSIIAS
ncbi:putative Leucine-rich repeat and immunoglobulin domain containing-NOGO receptor-interacting protein 4 [Daphnia magna]|uniref:Putative Leucine-rich repeat and immunoglobulin domain containing-NOGO receptor-interacting protein 4 n=1 Tax=Daphnia magna TaxID=35525 RepID=A0A164J4H5_9CRUS|nr:putative Leucine-rich repeat and immunoglobulin domain containing-NOGO receptor-interacting protein 4 [Daphnia magna]